MEKNSTEKVLIEIEEPCVMGLISPDEREPVLRRVIEKIRPEVTNLFTSETERILKETYNLSPEDVKNPSGRVDFSDLLL